MDDDKETTLITVHMRSLNADDLDIEEIENRIELASSAAAYCWNNNNCLYN